MIMTLLALFSSLSGPVVRTDRGWVRGREVNGLRTYLGIPYAAPPVGALRWRPPAPPASWSGIREAKAFGAACPQPWGHSSEDCLTLNVWSPAGARARPVMVWIHGGGFAGGASSSPGSEGDRLAAKGVVVVSVNYRLGALGFLAHPRLSAESARGVSGNYGLLDQIAALRWVRRNIAAFGGDPARVTVFGESAGGESVAYLLVSPAARGLFARAIDESGAIGGEQRALRGRSGDPEPMESVGERVAAKLGCSDVACLRARSADAIVAATRWNQPDMIPFGPVTDGDVLPRAPAAMLADGEAAPVPLLAGFNRDEAAMNAEVTVLRTVAQYRAYLAACFPDDAPAIERKFPAATDGAVREAVVRLLTVDRMARGVRDVLSGALAARAPAYAYHFTRVPPFARKNGQGAYHTIELYYVFGRLSGPDFDTTDVALADGLQTYWTRFAATGTPGAANLPFWPPHSAANREYLRLGDTVETGENLYADEMALLDRARRKKCLAAR